MGEIARNIEACGLLAPAGVGYPFHSYSKNPNNNNLHRFPYVCDTYQGMAVLVFSAVPPPGYAALGSVVVEVASADGSAPPGVQPPPGAMFCVHQACIVRSPTPVCMRPSHTCHQSLCTKWDSNSN
jgi:hypothetical protein